MAAKEDIVFSAKLDEVTSKNSLSALKKEFKELTDEVARATEGTVEYANAFKKLGAVKSEINDLNDNLKTLNPEGKIGAFQNVAGKLSSGFAAATGAAALFGAEAKEVEEVMLKVQAATALAEGIKGIQGITGAVSLFANVIKTQLVTAFSTLKGAIAATGIGALVIAIGVLINETMKYNEAIEEEYDKQRKLNEELKKTNDLYLEQAERSEKARNARAGGLNELERELKLLQAQGATAEEVAAKKQQILDKEIENLKIKRATIVDDSVLEAELNQKILDKENEKAVIVAEAETKKREELKKTLEEKKKLAQEEKELFEKVISDQNEIQEKQREKEAERQLKEKEKAAEEKELFDEIVAESRAEEDKRIEDEHAKRDKLRKENTEKEKAAAEEQKNARIQATNASLNAAKSLSDAYFAYQLSKAKGNAAEELKIRKKQFEVDKAFSIARAIIDGIRSVQAALTIPPPAGYILAAANGALAAANVIKIASAKFDGGATSGSVDSPNINTTAPTIQAPEPPRQQATTDLDRDGNNLSRPQIEVKAIVVESEMTDSQDRVGQLRRRSSF